MVDDKSKDRSTDTKSSGDKQTQELEETKWPDQKLTEPQQQLCELLNSKDGGKHSLGDFYSGAIRAWSDPHNDDSIAQTTHSLRELLYKLARLVRGHSKASYKRHNKLRKDMKNLLSHYENVDDSKAEEKVNADLRSKVREYIKLNESRQDTRAGLVGAIVAASFTGNEELAKARGKQAKRLWDNLEALAHHGECDVGVKEIFSEFEEIISIIISNETTINQKKILEVVTSEKKSKTDIDAVFNLIESENKKANRKYFFDVITETADDTWISALKEKGYFKRVPEVELSNDGWMTLPFWLPMQYLVRMASCKPNEVAKIVASIPTVDSPRACNQIVKIATLLSPDLSAELKTKVVEYVSKSSYLFGNEIAKLLGHWTKHDKIDEFLALLRELVRFDPDPKDEEKRSQRNSCGHQQSKTEQISLLVESSLEPRHRMDRYFFRETMTNSVRPLIEKDPLGVAEVLIKAVSHLLALKFHSEEDISGWDWHKPSRVHMLGDSNEPSEDTRGQEEVLVDTMMLACGKVYEKHPDKIETLDKALRNESWEFFEQLRMHLYANYPTSAKPWIRELILEHEGYGKWPFGQKFWNMIKSACDHFSKALPTKDWLTKNNLTKIFEAINNVQLDERQRQTYTEDHLRYWQFSPFKSLLFDKYQDIYHKLMDTIPEEKRKEPIHYRPPHTDRMSRHDLSPFSHDEIVSWGDEELLNHINTWEKEEQFIKDGWITSVNKSGFAAMFYDVFKKSIAGDPKRMEFWQQKCNEIKYPVYVQEMLYAMLEHVKDDQHDILEEYLIISEKVLIRSNEERYSEKGKTWKHKEPDWSSARWPICELVSEYLKKKVKPLSSVWEHLGSVLTMLCTQYDYILDDKQSQYHDNRNPANKGLNCIRGRSLEALVEFALIAKQYNDSSYVSTAKKVIEQRLSPQTEHSLKPEEYAILGVNYFRLHFLDKEWARERNRVFFPQDSLPAWSAAFGTFVSYCEPHKEMFEIVRENFAFAMQNLDKFRAKDNYGNTIINAFELKLFNFYLANDYSLTEKESLLEQYYQQTASDKKGRGDLIYKVGDSLRDKDNKFSNESTEKTLDFFRARLDAGDFVIMDNFSPWLDIEQLTIKERLSACLEVLKTCEIESFSTDVWLRKFCKMLPDYTAEVISCFAELVCCENSNILHISKEEVKAIVTAGRESGSESVCKDANRAVSCLLGKNLISLDDLED